MGKAGKADKLTFSDIFKFRLSFWFIVALCVTFYSAVFPFRSFAIKFFMHSHNLSRELAGELNRGEARDWVAGRIAFIFRKTQLRCDDVFKAMVGRGFSGEIKLYQYQKMKGRDRTVGFFLLVMASLFLWI